MNTPINEKVAQQVITYNISLQVPYLIITNGKETLGLIINDGEFASIQSLPIH
jgi:predicted type IV restriction endonuclease